MTADEKRARLVAKLMRMTTRKQIVWLADDATGGDTYVAEADGLRFRLYRELIRSPYESGVLGMAPIGMTPIGTGIPPHPGPVRLQLLDCETSLLLETITEADRLPLLKTLYEFVHRSLNKVDDKIDAFLARDVTHVQ